MNRENVMREALSDLEAQRANNIETERQRREEARAKSAEIAALLDERQKLFFSGMRGAFASPEKAKQISKDMQKKMEKINQNLLCFLSRHFIRICQVMTVCITGHSCSDSCHFHIQPVCILFDSVIIIQLCISHMHFHAFISQTFCMINTL